MQKFKFILIGFSIIILLTGCKTIKEKTDAIVEKENQKLSKFIGKSSNELQINLGKPDEDFKNEKGNLILVYNTSKYGIQCERRFEVNSNSIVIGFLSNGCFMALKKSEYAMISNFFRNVLNPVLVFYFASMYDASFEQFFWIWVVINWIFSITYFLFTFNYLRSRLQETRAIVNP